MPALFRAASTFATAAAVLGLIASAGRAADLTVRQVVELLFLSKAGDAADLRARNLGSLDLSGMDFHKARMAGADLYGVDLTSADLAGVDLSGARLDRAILTKANFEGAMLKGASLRTLSVFSSVEPNRVEAPRFPGANLSDTKIEGRLDGTDFRNADLSHATIGVQTAIWGSYRPRAVLNGADFRGARLVGTNFERSVLQFVLFADADLSGADLRETDLSRADLTNANLAGANLTGADLDGAILTGARGLDSVIGYDKTRNTDRVVK